MRPRVGGPGWEGPGPFQPLGAVTERGGGGRQGWGEAEGRAAGGDLPGCLL